MNFQPLHTTTQTKKENVTGTLDAPAPIPVTSTSLSPRVATDSDIAQLSGNEHVFEALHSRPHCRLVKLDWFVSSPSNHQ